LLKRHRYKLLALLVLLAFAAWWVYWNRTPKANMSEYVPADALAFIEASDLVTLANGITGTEAWRNLAQPLGAPADLIPHRWAIGLARWTGIGSTEAVLLARSQSAVVFAPGAQATQSGTTLIVKPLAALIIETHTSPQRMRPVIERQVEAFAGRSFGETTLTRKQVNSVDITEWKSPDNSRRLIVAVVHTVAIVGNDESVVLSCIEVRLGRRPSLATNPQLQTIKRQLSSAPAPMFAFVPKGGVKSLIQAFVFARAGDAVDAASIAPIISNTFGNLIDGIGCISRFDQSGSEDRCRILLAEGVAEQLHPSVSSPPVFKSDELSFVPRDASSVTSYQLRDPAAFWQTLGAVVSARSDLLGAVASREFLRRLLEPYGINDSGAFFSSIGQRVQVIRLDEQTPAVLVGTSFDRPKLRSVVKDRLGSNPKSDALGDAEFSISANQDWGIAFDSKNYFLAGPSLVVRRCVDAKARGESVVGDSAFRRALSLVDTSMPILALTFSQDRSSAISFVELFSAYERSAFSTSAEAIKQNAQSLPYAISITIVHHDSIEWSSRSSFGLFGSLFAGFAPERGR
jgi:hypothetical protein